MSRISYHVMSLSPEPAASPLRSVKIFNASIRIRDHATVPSLQFRPFGRQHTHTPSQSSPGGSGCIIAAPATLFRTDAELDLQRYSDPCDLSPHDPCSGQRSLLVVRCSAKQEFLLNERQRGAFVHHQLPSVRHGVRMTFLSALPSSPSLFPSFSLSPQLPSAT